MKRLFLLLAWAFVFAACGAVLSRSKDGGADGDGSADAADDWKLPTFLDGRKCEGMECFQVDCGEGGTQTTLSGIVRDPAGKNPLYNVFVYVPNRPIEPMPIGNPTCTACQAPASGQPLVYTSTNEKGAFTLTNVPVMPNMPLVMQLGKFRRQVTVEVSKACTTNQLLGTTNADKLRLPKRSSEGDMPLIAFATGCDKAECFLSNTIGIDASEFGTPGDSSKHVHLFRATDDGQALPGTPGDAYALLADLSQLQKYDIVFFACECVPYPRATKGDAYGNIYKYLEGGGRVFSTHYYYNLWAKESQCTTEENCGGGDDTSSVAEWKQGPDQQTQTPPFYIDDTHPRGKSMAIWLQNVQKGIYGQMDLLDTRADVGKVTKGTNWVYKGNLLDTYYSIYLSFNTPVPKPASEQCGRAVFSDVHLSGQQYWGGSFPTWCPKPSDHQTNEQALEFLFFDLSSCVQDDKQPPIYPPPH